MKSLMITLVLWAALCAGMLAQAQKPVRVAVAGPTTLTAWLIESMKVTGPPLGLSVEVVPASDENRDYLLAVAQVGSMANAVIALNRKGEVVACIARAGRFSNNDGMNISAKELVQKLNSLQR